MCCSTSRSNAFSYGWDFPCANAMDLGCLKEASCGRVVKSGVRWIDDRGDGHGPLLVRSDSPIVAVVRFRG
eukprot:4903886-Pyramimonas_sp.AAC.1